MGSSAQDKKTQSAASSGAQQQDQQLAQNAAQNQQFANQTRQNLFGTYAGGKYSGGSLSSYLDPNSTNTNALSGSYLNAYNNSSNKVNQGATNSVGTTMQAMANRGMGKAPAGFEADQMRKAYQDAAGQNGDLYSQNLQGQHNEAMSNFWNATNMLNSNASQTANLSLEGNQAAANNYANLYGTASQQKQNPWMQAWGIASNNMKSAAGAMA